LQVAVLYGGEGQVTSYLSDIKLLEKYTSTVPVPYPELTRRRRRRRKI